MKLRWKLAFILIFLFTLGCGKTIRTATDEDTITGSDWSASDLKRVSKKMGTSISRSHFLGRYPEARWVLAKNLRNDTDEHINTRQIMEKIRTQIINNGTAIFIDDQALDDILNQLRMTRSDLYDPTKIPQIGKLSGAKLILRGTISNIRQKTDSVDVNYYNITLQVVDMETGEIRWTDEAEIQRITEKGYFRS